MFPEEIFYSERCFLMLPMAFPQHNRYYHKLFTAIQFGQGKRGHFMISCIRRNARVCMLSKRKICLFLNLMLNKIKKVHFIKATMPFFYNFIHQSLYLPSFLFIPFIYYLFFFFLVTPNFKGCFFHQICHFSETYRDQT